MIYLLTQITACLVLAAILGWFIGWSWRGFRDQDRLEDARQTLRTTEEIKARELTEAYRQADAARTQADTLRRRLESRDSRHKDPQLHVASSESEHKFRQRPDALVAAAAPTRSRTTLRRLIPVANLDVTGAATSGTARDRPSEESSSAERPTEAEAALRQKTAAVLSLQAQVRALRAGTDARAEEMARLSASLIKLEPLEQQLSERNRQIEELERELADGRRKLQRQIERNRKQDAVHRSVVQDLQRQVSEQRNDEERAELQRTIDQLERSADTAEARWRDLLEKRDSGITDLRQQVEELEQRLIGNQDRERRIDALQEQLRDIERIRNEEIERYRRQFDRLQNPPPPAVEDDLQQIKGIGPKLSIRLRELGIWSFAQIAQWTPQDVERISRQIGAFPGRIRRDGWVQAARRLLQAP